jgi:hypothetical protein
MKWTAGEGVAAGDNGWRRRSCLSRLDLREALESCFLYLPTKLAHDPLFLGLLDVPGSDSECARYSRRT